MNTLPQKIDFAFRIAVLIFAMTIGVLFVFIGARNALAATLNPTVTVTGDVFTVGDVFGGLSQNKAQRVLGAAPKPGEDLVLNARTLMRVAIALDLPWRPASATDQITIHRQATLINANMIEDAVRQSLKENGVNGDFTVSFFNTPNPEMILPGDKTAAVEISSIDYDPKYGRFSVSLAAPSNRNPLKTLNLAGKVEKLIPVPVLKHTASSGTVINSHDIEWIDMKDSDLQNDFVVDEQALLGMTPRRMIVAGDPIRDRDLEKPQLVGRGDMITITFNDGTMALTAKGKALQDGSKGDAIRVINLASNRTIDAFVTDENVVTVTP